MESKLSTVKHREKEELNRQNINDLLDKSSGVKYFGLNQPKEMRKAGLETRKKIEG